MDINNLAYVEIYIPFLLLLLCIVLSHSGIQDSLGSLRRSSGEPAGCRGEQQTRAETRPLFQFTRMGQS